MAFRDQEQRSVDGHHLVKEHGDVHGARLGHSVVARPRAIVLMPLPHITLEGGLGVELELMDIDVLTEQLSKRFDQARMSRQKAEYFTECVSGKSCPRCAGFLAPYFLAVELEDVVRFRA